MTKREAKESLKALVRDHPCYRGIGLNADGIALMWSDPNSGITEHEGWPVTTTQVGNITAL